MCAQALPADTFWHPQDYAGVDCNALVNVWHTSQAGSYWLQGHAELPTVNLEQELFAKLQERAQLEGKSLAHLASEAVRQYVI